MRITIRRTALRSCGALAASAVALVWLGAAPALAAAPTIVSFTPTSGGATASVVIVGTGFSDGSAVTSVEFNGTPATFSVVSNTRINATVPAGATSGAITVTDSEGTASSLLPFTVTGALPVSISSVTPGRGSVGTSVTIGGTGLTGATSVKFNGTEATFSVGSDGQITAEVPRGATTGPITITTPLGTATSSRNFRVKSGRARYARSLAFGLRAGGRLVARGRVRSSAAACMARVPVKIQRKRLGLKGWRTVARDRTNVKGRFRARTKDLAGRYRALAPRRSTPAATCRRASSRSAMHR